MDSTPRPGPNPNDPLAAGVPLPHGADGGPTDESLAASAAREGSDGPAFVALVERFRLRVWHICYRLLGNEADAHDAAQDVFVALFVQRGKFRGEAKYSTWVHAVAVRTCLMLRRSRGRRLRRDGGQTGADLDAQPTTRPTQTGDAKLDLTQMLDILDEEDRALVLLKYAEGYEYEELAVIFELSVSACKMRVSRAREKIQARYGNE
ncbi:MAG: RNA polymerase sigma factor [Planctomycetia bacterium]|nr:RNA polymerase sigma factor [Planctomycetia bacterium]